MEGSFFLDLVKISSAVGWSLLSNIDSYTVTLCLVGLTPLFLRVFLRSSVVGAAFISADLSYTSFCFPQEKWNYSNFRSGKNTSIVSESKKTPHHSSLGSSKIPSVHNFFWAYMQRSCLNRLEWTWLMGNRSSQIKFLGKVFFGCERATWAQQT